MEQKIITISRQFGSAGRSIGKKVAQQLDLPYYDKELIKQVAEKTGFSPEYVENIGEYSPGKSIFSYAFSLPGTGGMMGGMSASDFLWVMQRQVILDLAEKGPCVIVGRCADYILREQGAVLNWFDITEVEGRFSLNDKLGDVFKTLRGKLWFATLFMTLAK